MKRDYEGRLMRNKSFTYILPMMSLYFDLVKEGLLNTFVRSTDYPKLKNHIFFLYKFSSNKKFLEYEDYLEKQELFEISYDPDKFHAMYVFKIPDGHRNIYDQFLKGRYSKFPQDYKVHIFKFHNITSPSHRVAQVLFRHPDLREEWEDKLDVVISEDAEVSSPPNIKLETYKEEHKYVNPLKPEEKPFE
tara:strand:+ start:1235 stop:1804 length:570 start_codon:yes stop_codon:yes gene_type:complete